MTESLADAIHEIANAIYKREGYAVTIPRGVVVTVLQAYLLLLEEMRKGDVCK